MALEQARDNEQTALEAIDTGIQEAAQRHLRLMERQEAFAAGTDEHFRKAVDYVIAGMRKPANVDEEQQVHDVAKLTVRAMINAAKADGRIDELETERLVGAIREDGVSDEEQRFVMEELRKPMDTDAIVRVVTQTSSSIWSF